MGSATSGIVLLALVALFLGTGVWIFSGLILVGISSLWLTLGFSLDRIGSIAAGVISSSAISWELAAVPMFLWMGEIIFRTDISQRLFTGLAPLARFLPGGLLHTNVLGCTLFAAVSGSSTATTATVGKITIGELKRRGYDPSLASGSLAGAGSFGLLIPPSISMIVYGVLAQVSIAKLFAAGVLPGLMMAVLYSGYIGIRCVIKPSLAPKEEAPASLGAVLRGLRDLGPIFILVVIVLGSIYSGLATPSEAAAVGVLGAILIVTATKQMTRDLLLSSLMAAIRVSSLICVLLAASAFLSAAIAFMHLPQTISAGISALSLGPFGLLLVLAVFYIIIGMFLDGISIIVMTLPIALPLILAAGLDPIWFGVYLVVMIEMSALTPPVGLNLYILQGLTNRSFVKTVYSALPFFLLLCLGVCILAVFPEIALWLPSVLFSR